MSESSNSYRQIVKATSIFGGVQAFNILISVIRSKAIAVLLGPTGMGLNGLFTSTINLVGVITNFGLGTSGVKSIAKAVGTNDDMQISLIVSVLKKCVFYTGILGMIITIVFSPWLSQLTFGSQKYTIAFIWLSLTFIFNQLSTGQLAILQGFRKFKYLASANLSGSVLGLLISLPLYYLYNIDGIVPALILTSIFNLIRSWYFSRKVKVKKISLNRELTLFEAKVMLKLGFVIGLSGIVSMAGYYLLRVYISNFGGIEQVGFYSAGFTLVNTYVGLVFTAMGTDYFPRLSAEPNNHVYTLKAVNEQAEMSFLLLTPVVITFIVFLPLILKILFTNEFLLIDKMIYWSMLGMLFKSASWSISFIFIAKGNSKVFFINETLASVYTLILNVIGYKFLGLTGVGVAFVLSYIFYLIHMSILSYYLYRVSFVVETIKVFIVEFVLILSVFALCIQLTDFSRYLFSLPILIFSLIYSYWKIDKRIGIGRILKRYINK